MGYNNLTDYLEITGISLIESIKKYSKYKCIIIKAGLTKTANTYTDLNGVKVPLYKNYTEKALREAVEKGVFENVPALFRSDEEHLRGADTGINSVVGSFSDVKWNDTDKQVEGKLNLKTGGEIAGRFRKMLQHLLQKTKSAAGEIGISISGIGKYVIEKLKDKYVAVVTEIESLQSIDPVSSGNAGGRLVALIESTALNIPSNNNLNEVKMNNELKQKIFDLFSSAMQIGAEEAGNANEVVCEAKKLLCEAQLQNSLSKSRLPEEGPEGESLLHDTKSTKNTRMASSIKE